MHDFKALSEERPELSSRLVKIEKREKIATMLLDIKEHGGIKCLLEELEAIVNAINTQLQSDNPSTDIEREKLLTDRQRSLWLIMKFPGAEQTIKNINNYLEKL